MVALVKRIPAILVLLSVSAMFAPAQAYDNPGLAAATERWHRELTGAAEEGANAAAAQQAWDQARRWARQRSWARAATLYVRAAELGIDNPVFWIEMSQALASRRPPDNRAALHAAYMAWRAARNDDHRAQALFHVGTRYQALGEGEKAITAYENGVEIRDNETIRQRLEALYAEFRHHIRRAYAVPESSTPQICLEFSRELQPADSVRYGDYVVVEPAIEPAFQVSGASLCVSGVRHGQTYRVTVRRGLPSTTELSLAASRELSVAVPDRSATLGFRGDAYILPRVSRQGIPLTSVNVDSAKLTLYRIGSRGLVRQLVEGRMRRLVSGYDARRLADTEGEKVRESSIAIRSRLNEEVTTAIPAESLLREPRPGLYVLLAEPDDEDNGTPAHANRATQWLVITDLAISTYQGQDGLHVFVRSFDAGRAVDDVRVRLLARNNEVLAEGESDDDGHVHFAAGLVRGSGGNRPAAVLVEGEDGDISFLDLLRPAFDLSDRGVGGRGTPGPVDAFLYTERGVYRPGETVNLTALLRSDRADAQADLPLTLRVRRPDGVIAREQTLPAGDGRDGGFTFALPLSRAAHTGRWTVLAHVDPEGAPVGSASFQVEDFVPERMEMTLETARDSLVPGTENAVEIEGRYLYGAPAAALRVAAEVVLRQDMNPYPDWRGYQFGLVTESWRATREVLEPVTTDEAGRARLPIGISGLPETTRPTKADVRVSLIEEGGRAVERVISVPVRGQDLVLGVRREGEGGSVPESEDAVFSLIALDGDGARRAAGGLEYQVVREDYQYQWFFRDGRWRYRVIRRDQPVTQGTVDIGGDAPAELSFRNNWGSYRLIVSAADESTTTSIRFRVGWFTGPSASDVPDKLTITADSQSYRAGDTARINIRPPFDGHVHLTVASDRLLDSRMIEVPRDGRTVEIEVEDDWGPGVYVTATAYRPMSQRASRGPARAIGVVHLERDFSHRTLDVSIEAPDRVEPRQQVTVAVKVAGNRDGRAHVTLAAVDEGILSLTGYGTPDPAGHYFGKRRLGVDIRDAYGRLIDPYAGQLGELRQGGDAAARERHLGGLDASSVKTVSLFSGMVEVDGSGTARIPLEIPDFNGRLRLMAVAWDRGAVGSAESDLVVRDPVVSIVTLPRFLAPGDRARVSVSLNNVDGAAGQYRLELASAGEAARFTDGAYQATLEREERGNAAFEIEGVTIGTTTVRMTLSGPDGFRVQRSWNLAVRPAQATISRFVSQAIEPEATGRYTDALFTDLLPGTGRADISFSSYPDWGMAGLIRALDRYPYGCAEQSTSRALPLLYLADVAETIGVAADRQSVEARVQAAIDGLVMQQRSDGAFGLWGAHDEREDWLTAYVMDFLTQAKEKGYLVPDPVFLRGIARLDEISRTGDIHPWNMPVIAYVHYVLASNRQARLGDMRYFHDNFLEELPTALAKAQLGAALALHGDRERSEAALLAARSHDSRPELSGRFWLAANRDYGSRLRDAAGVLYFISQSGNRSIEVDDLIQQVSRERASRRYMSTQEQAWLLLAAHSLGGSGEPMRLAVDGEGVADDARTHTLRLEAASIGDGVVVENRGDGRIWAGVSVSGIPAADMPAAEEGFRINRRFYRLDGTPADLTAIRQSEVLVALIEIHQVSRGNHQALVVDLLPSGFEIENPRLGGRDAETMDWLPELANTRSVEARDDRFVAAVDIARNARVARVAYVVRAVTPGRFRLPAAHVEDMYRPAFFGRMAMGNVVVRPRDE